MRGPGRRLSVLVAAGAAAVPAPAGAAILATEQRPTPVSAYGGLAAWSRYDPAADVYRLVARHRDGAIAPLPVAPRKAPFDVDLGPDARGRVVAVYSRCRVEPYLRRDTVGLPLWRTGRGCDVYRFGFRSRHEERVAEVSSRTASEFLPTIWRARIAFAWVAAGRDTGGRPSRVRVYVRTLGAGPTRRLPGGPRPASGTCRTPSSNYGPASLDLHRSWLAFAWNACTRSEIHLDTVRGGHRRLDRIGSGSDFAWLLSPTASRGSLYWSVYGTRDRSGICVRYRLVTRSRRTARCPATIASLAVDGGAMYYTHSPWLAPPCRSGQSSVPDCPTPVVRRAPFAFR